MIVLELAQFQRAKGVFEGERGEELAKSRTLRLKEWFLSRFLGTETNKARQKRNLRHELAMGGVPWATFEDSAGPLHYLWIVTNIDKNDNRKAA